MNIQTRKNTVERKKEIVDAVLKIIGERGLSSLSTKTIAEEVGVTTGALFRHFPSLQEILREVTRFAISQIEETFPDDSLAPLERIKLLAKNRIMLLNSCNGLAWLLKSEQAFLTLPEDSVENLRSMMKRSKRFLLKSINDGISEGSIRNDIEPEVLIVPIMGTIHSMIGLPVMKNSSHKKQLSEINKVLNGLEIMISKTSSNSK
jgi:AcrR family transcriptional regulator